MPPADPTPEPPSAPKTAASDATTVEARTPPAASPAPGPASSDRALAEAAARLRKRAGGCYAVEEEIGRGGMGTVYRAFDQDLKRHVALKVLRRDLCGEASRLVRFIEEAQATAGLEHPGIVPIHEIGLDDEGRVYYTMKLVRGRTLAQIVERIRAGDAATAREFTRFRLLEILIHVARAVAYAHERGFVHRDLKPQNIMIGTYGEALVLDWGLARKIAAPDPLPGAIVGTPAYMAPEQADGEAARLGPPADVYSLGATLLHVLAGRAPYEGAATPEVLTKLVTGERPPRARALDPRVPRELDAICAKAMERAPERRYAGALAFAADLQAYLERRPVAALPEGIAARALKAARRNQRLVLGALVVLAVALAASVAGLIRIDGERRAAVAHLARALTERAAARLATKEALAAEALLAEAIALEDSFDRRVRLLEARALGARLVERRAGDAAALAFAPDGALRILPEPPAKELASAVSSGAVVLASALDASGERLAVLTPGALKLFRIEPDARPTELPFPAIEIPPRLEVNDLALGPAARWVALASNDRAVHVFDLARGGAAARSLGGHDSEVARVAWSPDGLRLVSGTERGTLRVFDAETGRELLRVPALDGRPAPCRALAFDAAGTRIAAARPGGPIEVFELGETWPAAPALRGHRGAVTHVAIDGAGRRIASSGADGTVRLWDAARPGPPLRTLEGHEGVVSSVDLDPAGARVASSGMDATARIWDAATGAPLALHRLPAAAYQAVFSPDGARLAVAVKSPAIRIFDLAEGRTAVAIAIPPPHSVWTIAFRGDGRVLASGGFDGTIHRWDTATGAEAAPRLAAHDDAVRSVVFAPGGERLLSSAKDGTVRLWEIGPDGAARLARALLPHADDATAAAFAPGGRRLATGGRDGAVHVYDMAALDRPLVLRPHAVAVYGLAFAPDARRLVCGSTDGTIRVIDLDEVERLLLRARPDELRRESERRTGVAPLATAW